MLDAHSIKKFSRSEIFWKSSCIMSHQQYDIRTLQPQACDVRGNRRGQGETFIGTVMSEHAARCAVSASFMFARAPDGAPRQA